MDEEKYAASIALNKGKLNFPPIVILITGLRESDPLISKFKWQLFIEVEVHRPCISFQVILKYGDELNEVYKSFNWENILG